MPIPTDPTTGDAATLDTISPGAAPDAALETLFSNQPSTPRVRVDASPVAEQSFNERYDAAQVLGAGGMGEVRLCRDRRIGREVALKVMLPTTTGDADSRARFLREARVQGQLEHPTVVPVYDLGVAPDGSVYFTMKRVRGISLHDVLRALRRGDPVVTARFSRRKLLTSFASVCLSLDFAHARGVLHRDIKPANIMLGEFGEVHVLDWGLAKLLGVADRETTSTPAGLPDPITDGTVAKTLVGSLLGTPGYMSPEQARGQTDRLDARTDVYALGSVLFEILTGVPLHAERDPYKILQSTIEGVDARASVRRPEGNVPPELEAICVRATALDPAERFASAREMSDAIERFLDGDRDLERRRIMAEEHRDTAERAFERSRAGAEDAAEARQTAAREVARALALDPSDERSVALLARLLVEAPRVVPDEAQRELDDSAARSRARAARVSAVRHLTWLPFAPVILAMGLRAPWVGIAILAFMLAAAATAWWTSRPDRATATNTAALMVVSSVTIGLLSAVLGPFVIVPSLAATNAVFFSLHHEKPLRRIVTWCSLGAVLVPAALEMLGLVPPSYVFRAGHILVLPRMNDLPPALTLLLLVTTSITVIVTPAVLAGRARDALTAAERQLFLRSWQLRQLIPEAARAPLGAERS